MHQNILKNRSCIVCETNIDQLLRHGVMENIVSMAVSGKKAQLLVITSIQNNWSRWVYGFPMMSTRRGFTQNPINRVERCFLFFLLCLTFSDF